MEEIKLAAFHEAGHVVMRHHYALSTPAFFVHEDGTGYTAPSFRLIMELDVQIDITLAGQIAEDLLQMRTQAPTLENICDSIDTLACDELSDDWFGDLEDAIHILQLRHPRMSPETVLDTIKKSYERCALTLKQKWTIVKKLATEALASPNGAVYEEAIERICSCDVAS